MLSPTCPSPSPDFEQDHYPKAREPFFIDRSFWYLPIDDFCLLHTIIQLPGDSSTFPSNEQMEEWTLTSGGDLFSVPKMGSTWLHR